MQQLKLARDWRQRARLLIVSGAAVVSATDPTRTVFVRLPALQPPSDGVLDFGR